MRIAKSREPVVLNDHSYRGHRPFGNHQRVEPAINSPETIYHEDCLKTMAWGLTKNSVDLILTSPPYDDLRDYNGHSKSWDFKQIASYIPHILKPGGVLVWIVGDSFKNSRQSCSSYRQALYFVDTVGLNLFDTMIYEKSPNASSMGDINYYMRSFEFMFIFVKGVRPKTINLIKDRKNKQAGYLKKNSTKRSTGDKLIKRVATMIKEFGRRTNIWRYQGGHHHSTNDTVAFGHPAICPEDLAADHIKTWTNPGDFVYDPFGGSGTTAKMAHQLDRKWAMSEISKEYVELAQARLKPYVDQGRMKLGETNG